MEETDGFPDKYIIELDPAQELDLGRYYYIFIIEMEDYPSVGQEELRFDVIINPCLVTSLDTAVIPEKVEYIVGNIQKSVTYSFT